MKFWLKVHAVVQESREELMIGICDENILGKKFGYSKISEHFFKGDLVDLKKALTILKKATNANIIGKNIIDAAIKEKIIEKDNVKKTDGIPHAHIITL